MHEIKNGWKKVRMLEISLNITDGTHGTVKDDKNGDYFLLSCKNIKLGNIVYDCNDRKIDKINFEKLNKRTKLEYNDVLITTVGTIGETAIIKDKNINYEFQRSVAIIKPNINEVLPLYLFYYISGTIYQNDIKGLSRGVAQQCLFLEPIRNSEILLPPLPTQQKIASILSKYDDLIENNNKRIKILEETAQSIYEEWFVRYNFPGSENIKMIDSGNDDFGMIPEGWKVKKVGESFTTVLGGTPSRIKEEFWGGNIPWINSGKVNDLMIINQSEFITELGYSKSSTKLMPKGTTVIAITGATLGQVSILGIEACANQSVIGIYDETGFYSNYIYYFFMNNINRIISHAGGGAQQHINKDIVSQTKLIIPTYEVIDNLNKNMGVIIDEMKNLFFQNQNLKETRDLLIPRLVSGDLDVESLDVK